MKDFFKAKPCGTKQLQRKEIWKEIDKNDTADEADIVAERFWLKPKNFGKASEKEKARLVAQGCRDNKKTSFYRKLLTERAASARNFYVL